LISLFAAFDFSIRIWYLSCSIWFLLYSLEYHDQFFCDGVPSLWCIQRVHHDQFSAMELLFYSAYSEPISCVRLLWKPAKTFDYSMVQRRSISLHTLIFKNISLRLARNVSIQILVFDLWRFCEIWQELCYGCMVPIVYIFVVE